MTLTFDLLTSKSIGHILASWGVCMWSFMMIGVKGKQLCAGNHFQSFMHCDLDLWTFDLKMYRAHPCLMGSLHLKFHDDRCKGKAVMCRKPFSVIYVLWPWPFDLKIYRAHPCLMGVCMWSFMMIGVKGKQLCAGNHFQSFMHCDLDLLTSKSIGHILASWGVCMWSFMMIGVKGKQLCAWNHFQ